MRTYIPISHSVENSPCFVFSLECALVFLTGDYTLCGHHFFLTGFEVVNVSLLCIALYIFALEDPKGQSESVNRRRTDTTMPQNKSTIGPTTIYK